MRRLALALALFAAVGCSRMIGPPGPQLAPLEASYLALGNHGSLTAERVFTPSARFSATDNGAGSTYALDLATTAVTPASYTNTSLTVDAYGRITAASSGSGGADSTWRGTYKALCEAGAGFTAGAYSEWYEDFSNMNKWSTYTGFTIFQPITTLASTVQVSSAASQAYSHVGTGATSTSALSTRFMKTNGKWCLAFRVKPTTPSAFPMAGTERFEIGLQNVWDSAAVRVGFDKTVSTTKWFLEGLSGSSTTLSTKDVGNVWTTVMVYSNGTTLYLVVNDGSAETAVTGPAASAQGSNHSAVAVYAANTVVAQLDEMFIQYAAN